MKRLRCDNAHWGTDCMCNKTHEEMECVLNPFHYWYKKNAHIKSCCHSEVDEIYEQVVELVEGLQSSKPKEK